MSVKDVIIDAKLVTYHLLKVKNVLHAKPVFKGIIYSQLKTVCQIIIKDVILNVRLDIMEHLYYNANYAHLLYIV